MAFALVVRDKYNEEYISFILGPYKTLTDAQEARRSHKLEDRWASIYELLNDVVPGWERNG